MRFSHPAHPGRGVRLAYCSNLHPAEDVPGVLQGLRAITLPLAERLRAPGEDFGVGLWLPADAAFALSSGTDPSADELRELLVEERLDPFTFNAFPYGGFHRAGLKEGVFRPTWLAPERLAYTLAVARTALAWRAACAVRGGGAGHLSISTHCGAFGAWVQDEAELDGLAENLALMALHLAQLEDESGVRVVLSLEPEPRSTANDTRALGALRERVLARSHEVLGRGFASVRAVSEDIVLRHLGTCLDVCHAAVEFEEPAEALANSTGGGAPLGKLQFSSALSLAEPDAHTAGRAALLALDEPVFLHQVTGRRGDELVRATDLPELGKCVTAGDLAWRGSDEWRCHFHVPVDLGDLGPDGGGLGTTRALADAALAAALAAPERWGTDELHVEIETYTWNVLPGPARGAGSLVDGLEREYRHVLARLAEHGWQRAAAPQNPPGSR